MTVAYVGAAKKAVSEQKAGLYQMQRRAVDNVVDWFRGRPVNWYQSLVIVREGTLSLGRLRPLGDFLDFG
jgi:hypothetical protein